MHPDRPQAPGYLANLMARLFHDIAAQGLDPPISRRTLAVSQEAEPRYIDALIVSLAADGLIAELPGAADTPLILSDKGRSLRDAAMPAARRANQAAAAALSETEMAQFLALMNRVIDALQEA